MKKKILSIILSLVMVLTVVPFVGLASFAAEFDYSNYCLCGYINGADYGMTMQSSPKWNEQGEYVFDQNGKLTATFSIDSYVEVKTLHGEYWYAFENYVPDGTTTKLYEASDTYKELMFVPAGTAYTFTLSGNPSDGFQLGYAIAAHTHNGLEFTPWGSGEGESTSLPAKTGNYYLTSDIKLNGAYTPAAGVSINICLDGHVIQQTNGKSPVIKFMNAAEVNIYDCNTEAKHYFKEDATGLWVLQNTSDGADHTVTGGVLTGGKNLRTDSGAATDYGGGVCIRSGVAASFGLHGGTICGNAAYYGGGIYNKEAGTVTITNGAVCGNTATTIGGGIMTEGKVLLNAAEGKEIVVTDNVATLGHGGILNYDAEMHVSGKITVKDNVCDKKITETVTYPKNLSTSVPLTVDGALTGSEIYITHAELESDHHDGLVLTKGYKTNNPEAGLDTFFKYDGPYTMFINNDGELEITEANVTEWHLNNKICDSFNGKGGLMARQGLRDKSTGTVSKEVGRTIIALTQKQLDSIGEEVLITGNDGRKSVKQVIDCAYTYFYDGDTKIETEGLTVGGEDVAAFIIFDNTGTQSETITGYGYYRVYDNTTGTFLFDTLYAAPAN